MLNDIPLKNVIIHYQRFLLTVKILHAEIVTIIASEVA
jgi:hypothetical protein